MSNRTDTTPPNESATRNRRGSFTTQTFNNIFGRSNSTASPTAPFPGPITTAAAQDQRRRMSISTLGLSGTSPTQSTSFNLAAARRGSVSTAGSESIDENAIDDEDGPGRSQPNTPFTRRVSFGAQALLNARGPGSPGTSGRAPSYTTSTLPSIPSGPRSARAISEAKDGGVTPPRQASMQSMPRTNSDFPVSARPGEGGFNWSEQLRSRAESLSQSQRLSFATQNNKAPMHDRAKSITEIPAPPTAVPAPAPAPVRPERKKPDAMQERILKGDFYMD